VSELVNVVCQQSMAIIRQ